MSNMAKITERLSDKRLEELHSYMAYGREPGASQLNDEVFAAVSELRARRAAEGPAPQENRPTELWQCVCGAFWKDIGLPHICPWCESRRQARAAQSAPEGPSQAGLELYKGGAVRSPDGPTCPTCQHWQGDKWCARKGAPTYYRNTPPDFGCTLHEPLPPSSAREA